MAGTWIVGGTPFRVWRCLGRRRRRRRRWDAIQMT